MSKNTKLVVFCGTVQLDKSWIFMIKYFKKVKGYDVETHTSLRENGVDLLKQWTDKLKMKLNQILMMRKKWIQNK